MNPDTIRDIAHQSGWIEVITGSMFSGKTEELIRRLKRVQLANQSLMVFKPVLDSRYSADEVVSHDAQSFPSTAIDSSSKIIDLAKGAAVIGIDEAQFFDDALPDVCQQLANVGKRVIVAGLDMDYLGKPFGTMPQLMAIAEYINKLHAICTHCGSIAQYSFRKSAEKSQLLLGADDAYEALCRCCYDKARIIQ
jgi:thymidine kinase